MEKEIHEQPTAIGETLGRYLDPATGHVGLPGLDVDLAGTPRVTLIACGTAHYAALVGKHWLERLARLPVEVDVASEFRYRDAPMPEGGVAVFVSQSGETADTLAALRDARRRGQTIVTVTNTETSTMARESDVVLATTPAPRSASRRPRPSPANSPSLLSSPSPRPGRAAPGRTKSSGAPPRRWPPCDPGVARAAHGRPGAGHRP